MVQFAIFSSHKGALGFEPRKLYFTMFGGFELQLPTVTGQLNTRRRDPNSVQPQRSCYFVTLFGSVELRVPTLTEEYVELIESLRTRTIELEEWDRCARMASAGELLNIGSLTLFGGFEGAKLPTENEELDRLALAYQTGQIRDPARKYLMLAIGQSGAQRLTAVRQAVAALPAGA